MSIKPIMKYAVMAWAPYIQKNINKIEAIQYQAARFVMSDFSTCIAVSLLCYLRPLQINSVARPGLRHIKFCMQVGSPFPLFHYNYIIISSFSSHCLPGTSA